MALIDSRWGGVFPRHGEKMSEWSGEVNQKVEHLYNIFHLLNVSCHLLWNSLTNTSTFDFIRLEIIHKRCHYNWGMLPFLLTALYEIVTVTRNYITEMWLYLIWSQKINGIWGYEKNLLSSSCLWYTNTHMLLHLHVQHFIIICSSVASSTTRLWPFSSRKSSWGHTRSKKREAEDWRASEPRSRRKQRASRTIWRRWLPLMIR